MQAYCMKCRAKREMKDTRAITMKNGKPATQGVCPVCGTKMFRIGSKQQLTVLHTYQSGDLSFRQCPICQQGAICEPALLGSQGGNQRNTPFYAGIGLYAQ